MGSAASKGTKSAVSAASKRQYPKRSPPTSNPSSKPSKPDFPIAVEQNAATGSAQALSADASLTDTAKERDAHDTSFAASLRSLGPVQPNSTLSNTSTFRAQPSSSFTQSQSGGPHPPQGGNVFPSPQQNSALEILKARDRIREEAEKEFTLARQSAGSQRTLLDIGTIRQILTMRDDKGMKAEYIEQEIGLKPGVVSSLSTVSEGRVGRKTAGDSGIYG